MFNHSHMHFCMWCKKLAYTCNDTGCRVPTLTECGSCNVKATSALSYALGNRIASQRTI